MTLGSQKPRPKARGKGTPPLAGGVRPLLRWAGSKRRQVARLKLFWRASHKRYVEPFAGSACLFFELGPPQAILGDNNASLMQFYRVARWRPKQLHWRLCHIPRDSGTYYRWRDELPPCDLDSETQALRFLYLNRNCFNGIYRTNLAGAFNVPFGRKQGTYFRRRDALSCSKMLRRATLVSGDFADTLKLVKKGDFVYMDPPFAVEARRVFRHYGSKSFNTPDLPRLAQELRRLAKIGADFVVSYADSSEARTLARRWNAVRLPTRRYVAGFVDRRRKAYEWLISNMPLPAAFGALKKE